MKLRVKIIVFFLLATILPATILFLFYQTRLTRVLLEKNEQYMDTLATEKASYVDENFGRLESAVFDLKTDTTLIEYFRRVDSENYRDIDSRILTSEVVEKVENLPYIMPYVQGVAVLPALSEGIDILRGRYSGAPLQMEQIGAYLERALENPEAILYDVVHQPKENTFLLHVTACSIDRYSERVVGYVLLQVNITEFFSSSQASAQSDWSLIVTDAQDRIIARQGPLAPPVEADMLLTDGDSEAAREVYVGGMEYITVRQTVPATDWNLVFLVDKSQITEEVRQTTLLTGILILMFVFFALAAAIYLYYQFYEPVRLLTHTMQRVEQGTLDLEVTVKGRDEISKLGHTYNHLIREIKRQMQEIEETQKKKTEMEIRALQAQITPHFLYNTLNSIKSLSRLGRTEEVTQMTEALIDLLRLSASKTRLITLGEELQYVQAYTSLMSYRSGRPYGLIDNVPDKLREIMIPKFLLQPIVENSIIHGFSQWAGTSPLILVSAVEEDGQMVIQISDNGSGITGEKAQELNVEREEEEDPPGPHKFNGIGIHNIRQRLVHEFGPEASMEIDALPSAGTRVTLSFPRGKVPPI